MSKLCEEPYEQYNIPIRMVILEKHPVMAPYVFVQPTSTMSIKQGRHVDANGKVYLPYLSEWKKGRHDLKGLVEILCKGNILNFVNLIVVKMNIFNMIIKISLFGS